MANKETFDAMRIFFAGVGGQGTLLATRLVGEACLRQGLRVTMSEIHGMAQRGGVVESTIVVGDLLSPLVSDGEADVLLAFEPLEGLRALPKCHPKSWIIMNTVPIVPFTVAAGQGRYPSRDEIYHHIDGKVSHFIRFDANELAREAGVERAANVSQVGVFAGTAILPVEKDAWSNAVKEVLPPHLHEANLKAFDLGYALGQEQR